jgi:hypothetical protein
LPITPRRHPGNPSAATAEAEISAALADLDPATLLFLRKIKRIRILAKHQLQFDSRAFAPLRRDERNAWDRAPGAREAYIAPALKPDGSANPRWITRSDWEMDRRIVATTRTERLFDLYKIYVLVGRPGSAEASYVGPRRPVDALLEKYAHDTLDAEPPPASAPDKEFRAWRADVRDRVTTLIGEIRRDDEPERKQIARKLAGLSDRERIWGRETTTKSQRPH